MTRRVVPGLLAFALLTAPLGAQQAMDPLLAEGFDLAYNLDHEPAIAKLRQAIAERPDDPAPHRGTAAIAWLRILYLRGGILVDNYMTGSVTRPGGKLEKPPPELDELFHTHLARAVELSEDYVRRAPDDANAHYELGASVALAASYRASIEGESLRALRDAKRAYEAHETVLALDPSRKDAQLTLGIYRYIVSLLPRAFRMMAYLVGFDGGRLEAIRLVEEAAAYPSEAQAEAKFALVLLYNRERNYARAQRVMADLKRRYPRNRLVWLESAATWLRDDRPLMAELTLVPGFRKLEADDRDRMFGEQAVWRLTRGTARVAVGRPADAATDLRAAVDAEGQRWVTGRAHLELGKIADLGGDRAGAREAYDRSRRLCDDARDRACVTAAKALRDHPYAGP